jgi:predicted HTH domain antitoxin
LGHDKEIPTESLAVNRSLNIEYPSTLPDALHQTPAEFERDARLAMAVKLFEMKRLSSGQAAPLAGIDRTTFLMRVSESRVAMIVDMPAEELADDVRNAVSK